MFTAFTIRALAACALLALASGPTLAQTPTGTISGRVTDSGNAAVPGATVTIESPQMQGTRSTVTSANGDYIFPSLSPGAYTITVELTGFGTVKQTRDVGAGQPVTADVTLRPASLSEVVTVTARTDAFTNTVQASTNIQQELLATLPTARTVLSAVNLAPARACHRPEQRHHHRRRDVVREPVHPRRRADSPTTSAARRSRSSSKTRSRRPRSRPRAFPPSTAASPAASSTRSRSRAATSSADRCGRRSPTTTGGR